MTGFVSRRAVLILAVTALLTIVAYGLGANVVSRLKSGASLFQDPHAESVRAFDLLQTSSGLEPDPGIVALVRPRRPRRPDEDRPRSRGGPDAGRRPLRARILLPRPRRALPAGRHPPPTGVPRRCRRRPRGWPRGEPGDQRDRPPGPRAGGADR